MYPGQSYNQQNPPPQPPPHHHAPTLFPQQPYTAQQPQPQYHQPPPYSQYPQTLPNAQQPSPYQQNPYQAPHTQPQPPYLPQALPTPAHQAHSANGIYHWDPNIVNTVPVSHSVIVRRKCLLVGINYTGQRGQLRGCINDCHNARQTLTTYFGFPNDSESMLCLTDDQKDWRFQPTRANIIAGLRWLITGVDSNTSLFFQFSGHGGSVKDQDGDEDDGYDECIYPVDHAKAGSILDDELFDTIVRPLPPGARLTAVFDACHSGTVLDLGYVYFPDGTLKISKPRPQIANSILGFAAPLMPMLGLLGLPQKAISAISGSQYSRPVHQVAIKPVYGEVVSFSGCTDSQTSADASISGNFTGAMSHSFFKVLRTAKERGELLSYGAVLGRVWDDMKGKFVQRPQMSSGKLMNTQGAFLM